MISNRTRGYLIGGVCGTVFGLMGVVDPFGVGEGIGLWILAGVFSILFCLAADRLLLIVESNSN